MPGGIEVVGSGLILARDVEMARSWRERARGLRDKKLKPGQALVLEPAKQVHTFGMRYAIDVAFCDKSWVVKHVVRNMPSRKVTRIVPSARYAIEFPGGSLPDEVVPGIRLRVRSGD